MGRVVFGVLIVMALSGCALPGTVPPDGCGFPPGTPLAFSGRTTMNQVGLLDTDPEQVHGNDRADIYVTLEPIEAHGLRGRMACLMYVDFGGIEIIEVPSGWQPARQCSTMASV
jgi:hypothetical protein